jgi:hypothetical protein
MPRIHISLAGHEIKYDDPDPKTEKFLKRVQALAENPKSKPDELVTLVYGSENPILDHTLFPERGAVTKEVLENPVYHVLTDLLARKQVAASGASSEQLGKRYTLTVAQAAEEAGVTKDAIRKAITSRRLPSWVRDGQYYIDPRTLAALGFGSRLPFESEPFEFEVGYDAVTNSGMRIKTPTGEFPKSQNEPLYDDTCDRWRRVAVRCSSPTGIRVFVLEPGKKKNKLPHHHFFVVGKFDIVEKHNSDKAAREFWKAFKAS